MKLNLLFLTALCITLAATLPVETPTDSDDAKLCSEPITSACIETDKDCDKEKISNRKKRQTICPALIAGKFNCYLIEIFANKIFAHFQSA